VDEQIATRSKRVESIDAFRGFTILAMIFVIQVAGYKHLPLTFPHFGSAPVSTFKHASEDSDPSEWAFWEGQSPAKEYIRGRVLDVSGTAYTIEVEADDDEATRTYAGVSVTHAKPLRVGDSVFAHFAGARKLGTRHPRAEITPTFHGFGNGCTFTDLVAPFFVFIVGMCIPLSRQRRGGAWWSHVGKRTLGLIIAGIIYISLILKLSYWWGILQAIGVSYFMAAAALFLPPLGRWGVVAALALLHGVLTLYVPWWVELGDKTRPFLTIARLDGDPLRPLTVHCTPWASISYGMICIIGTLLGEAIASRQQSKIIRQSLLLGAIFTTIGYLLHRAGFPMNKEYVTSSYSLFTSGVGAVVFLLFYLLIDVLGWRRWAVPFNVFGANALLAYFLQPIVRIFVQALGLYPFFVGKAGWNGMLWGAIWTLLLWIIVRECNKRGFYWKL
jgi:predicted acyltransferase